MLILEAPADQAHARVGEVSGQLAHRVALEARVGVGEDEDLPARLRHRLGERDRLPRTRRALVEGDPGAVLFGERPEQLAHAQAGRVARPVGDDGAVEPLYGVVELEEVPHLGLDHRLLVVRRDQERGRGQLDSFERRRAPFSAAAEPEQDRGVAEVGGDQRPHEKDEERVPKHSAPRHPHPSRLQRRSFSASTAASSSAESRHSPAFTFCSN